ncbi:MAG: T9SS type A sorting domain-containing protein [Bacteroidota bacterium]
MKQTLKLSFLLALMLLSIAVAEKKTEKGDEMSVIPFGKTLISPEQVNAASSPWLPRNLETPTSQFKVAEFFKNGFVLIAGAKTTAPMLGNYYGFYSKDSGKSFTKFSFPNFQSSATSTSPRFAGIATWGDSVMINADYAGVLIRSTNYGVKWDTVSAKYGTGAFYDGVEFISKDTVIAYGDGVDSSIFINRSTDRGATWTRVSLPTSADIKAYVVASAGSKSIATLGNTIWLGVYVTSSAPVSAAGVLKSTDAGLTWTLTKVTNLLAKNRYSLANMSFKDANVGYAIGVTLGYINTLHKTTDGGATWSDSINVAAAPISSPLLQQVAQVQALAGTSTVLVSGFDGTGPAMWKSTDDGATWTKIVTPLNGGAAASLGQIAFISENTGFGAGVRIAYEYSPSVEVTFIVNTSTVPDTLKGTSTVQMRGDGGASGGLLDWSGKSSVRFTNIGGDYWRAKVRFASGKDFPYKIYTHAQPNVNETHAGKDNGWENNITTNGNGNRRMVVGASDTTIAVQFVNGSSAEQPQYWRPYVESDSLEVTFRINMANQEDFNPLSMKVGVNGSFQGWGTPSSFVLKQETNHGNGGSVAYLGPNFWSGTFKLPLKKANLDTLSAPIKYEYKFVQFNNATPTTYKWENVANRSFEIKKGSADTTIYWVWWENVGVKPPAGNDTAMATFRVDMSNAIATNGYTTGDTVQVRYGFANSATVVGVRNLAKQGLTNIYAATDSNITGVKVDATGTKPLVYQYYIVKNGQDFRESYYNFSFTGQDQTLAERRMLPLTSKKSTGVLNAGLDTSKNQTKANRWPFFRNTRKLTKNVAVTFTLNLAPAYWQVAKGDTLFGIQNTVNVTNKDSVYKWGVAINGPASGGWGAWGNSLIADPKKVMFDDGTNGDAVAGDHIYTKVINYYKDSVNNVVGQEFKFGIKGGDNEGGKGGFGNNHIENINDAAATATIANQFGSINPLYYNQWDYANGVKSVKQIDGVTPTQFELSQNYPNPFNPSTVINYSIPVNGLVSLKVYNVLGQQVATLVNEVQTVGSYKATFNATSLSSGVYFYKIEAGSFTSVKKMMFLK